MQGIHVNKQNHFWTFVTAYSFVIFSTLAHAADEEDLEQLYGDEELVSIATGKTQLISKAPAVASVITERDIRAMGANDIDEVLESVPGLHVSLNEFYNPIYTVRGIYSKFNPQVLMLINGTPISNLYLGNRGLVWAGMPIESIARIEVIRGPGSAVYGADAFAGTVNIITKDGSNIKENDAGILAGDFGTQSTWLNHSTELGDFEVTTSFQYLSTDGHKETIDSDLQTILDMLDGTSASLAPNSVNLSRDSLDLRLDIKKGFWKTRLGLQKRNNVGTGAGVAEALDSKGRFKSVRRNLDVTYDTSDSLDNWQIESKISYFYTTQEVEDNIILFPSGSELNLGAGTFTDGVIGNPEVLENHLRFNTSAFYKGFEKHTMRIGLGYHDAEISEVRESKNFGLDGNGNFIVPGSPAVSVDDTPFIFLPEGSRYNRYAFLQDIWQFSNDWELTSGLRYDYYSDFGSTVNPRLALVWSTSNDLTTKFLYGKAFRAPSFAETRNQNNPVALGNPDLEPEEIETFEVAFDYKPNNDIRFGLNLYNYKWEKIIDFIPDTSPATTTTAQNEGKQNGKGLEFEFDWKISGDFKLIGNYAYQKSTIENTDSDAPNSPEQQIYTRIKWNLNDSLTLSKQINYIMNRNRTASDSREKVDDYHTVNLALSYQKLASPWELKLIAKNIFDKEAYEPSSTVIPNDLPIEPRSAYISLRFSF